MASKGRYAEFIRYPKYKENYIKAFDKMLLRNKEKGITPRDKMREWETGEDVFRWWMGENVDQLKINEEWWII